MTQTIRIATRKSPLALWQAHEVSRRLQALNPDLTIELVKMVTQGDKILDSPLAKIGGKGLFVKELEEGMLAGEADIAVHSMKDVPAELPEGFQLAVIMQREDPRDAFVSNRYASLDDLPSEARVGTCSLRRQTQLKERFPDFKLLDLRGNVNTRLAKLDNDDYDAIILAAAGLIRLEMPKRIKAFIEPEQSLPAVGQGAVGIECRLNDPRVEALLAPLHDTETALRVTAERAMNLRLQGGCQVPIGGFALVDGDQLYLRGLVGSPDGREVVRAEIRGNAQQAEQLGTELAETLLNNGARTILNRMGIHPS